MLKVNSNENILTLNQSLSLHLPQSKSTKFSLNSKEKARIKVLILELARLGFKLDQKLLDTVKQYNESEIHIVYEFLIEQLKKISGDHVDYIPLFLKFPQQVPDDVDYLIKRFIGFFISDTGTVLSCGHIVDPLLFNLEDFGACPICQFQVKELSQKMEESKVLNQTNSDLKLIKFVSLEEQYNQINNLFNYPRPYSETQKELLLNYLISTRFDFLDQQYLSKVKIKAKENLAFIVGSLIDTPDFKLSHNLLSQVTSLNDVLRLAVYLSSKQTSLVLKNNVKFTLKNKQRKLLLKLLDLSILNNSRHILVTTQDRFKLSKEKLRYHIFDESLKYRGMWLNLGKYLHVGSYFNKYSQIKEMFDLLRNHNKSHKTYSQKLHKSIIENKTAESIDRLSLKPGLFFRNLDMCLRKSSDEEGELLLKKVVEEKILEKIPTSLLIKVLGHFKNRHEKSNSRYFILQGTVSNFYLLDNDDRKSISLSNLALVQDVITNELVNRFSKKSAFSKNQKVYIDSTLKQVLVPLNIQNSTKSIQTLQRGSRIKIEKNKDLLRLFVYWKNPNESSRVDIDLSLNTYNHDLTPNVVINFRNLSGLDNLITHSGDIQSAPVGASEFIDIKYKELLKQGIRYLAPSVICFTGQSFNKVECFSGLMFRTKSDNGKLFEPSTVSHKYDLTGESTSSIPFVLDLETGELIWTDLNGAIKNHGTANDSRESIAKMIKIVQSMSSNNLSIYNLIQLHISASGALLVDQNQADLKINLNDCLDPVDLLSKYISV